MFDSDTADTERFEEILRSSPVKEKKRACVRMLRDAHAYRRRLTAAYHTAYKRAASGLALSNAQRLLTNEFYTIEKQLVTLIKGLEEIRGVGLPAFASGAYKETPRIRIAAEAYVQSRSAVCGAESVKGFFTQLDPDCELTHDELCTLPLAIKLALVCLLCGSLQDDEGQELYRRNIMLSLRALDDAAWDELITDISPVVRVLRQRPEYCALDAQSRGYCLQKVKRIAKSLGCGEVQTALAAAAIAEKGAGAEAHVGYYLAGEGEDRLRKALRPDAPRLPLLPGQTLLLYCLAILGLTDLLLLLLVPAAGAKALLALYPALTVAVSVVSQAGIMLSCPRFVLRRAPEKAEFAKTAVAVPVLLTDASAVSAAAKRLEAHYVANPVEGVRFMLLADLPDADAEETEDDSALIVEAKRRIAELNSEYGDRFVLLCRKRKPKAEGGFAGYERKRGAVMQLCRMLCGSDGCFDIEYPEGEYRAEYLALLDGDTVLPHGVLQKLLGAAALELNRPVISHGVLKKGCCVFVPNIRTTSRSAARSGFARLFSGESGAEPYSSSISNLHMDLFASGDFGGKGMVITEPFYRLLRDAVPPDTVLSHDLLEGSITGAAFINDVYLYDDQPHTLPRWWKRQERWIRGDWQLLPYIFGSLQGKLRGALPRIKMLGNLMHSLREPATLALFVTAVCIKEPWLFAAALFGFLFEPVKHALLLAAASLRRKQHFGSALLLALRSLTELAVLPYSAACAAAAVAKALWRQLVSRKNMLQWQTNAAGDEKAILIINCVGAAVMAVLTAAAAVSGGLGAVFFGAILSVVWLIGIPVVRTLDREPKKHSFIGKERREIMELFMGAWRFFAENCGEENGFLPPDNVQHVPQKPAVSRTSPTNIGMALLAGVCAFDVGVIDAAELLRRMEGTVSTLERLEKWQGCPYNWYSTVSFKPLAPRFVSSVDSGNLAASLMVSQAAAAELGAKELARRCRRLVDDMKLEALYDTGRRLFYIGRDVDNGAFSPSHYDLYASEARILSFVSVALGKTPASHWRHISRVIRVTEGGRVLLSWSGTAFEYLMPLIFFETVPGSLQYEVCLSAVRTQLLAKRGEGMPWGVSECGYHCFDEAMYYRYRAFGEPGLALEPNAERPRIYAPYAAALALFAEPEFALEDLRVFKALGCVGRYGMYEAIDYSASEDGSPCIVKSSMAHHKGMELCAYAAALTGGRISKRFMSLPRVRAYEELLFEHMPIEPIVIREYENSLLIAPGHKPQAAPARTGDIGSRPVLEGQLLSNGVYSVHVFADGTSRSFFKSGEDNIAVTDDEGLRVMIKTGDMALPCSGAYVFEPHRAEISRVIGSVTAKWDTVAASDAGAELHELRLINKDVHETELRVGVFCRPALCTEREYKAHPSFVRLRVEAEQTEDCMLYHMRGGSAGLLNDGEKAEEPNGLWMFAALKGADGVRYSSDAFTSPGRLASFEEAMQNPLPDKVKKHPIEPFLTVCAAVKLPPQSSKTIDFVMGCASTRTEALDTAHELLNEGGRQRALAAQTASGLMRGCGVTSRQASEWEPLAARIAKRVPFKPKTPFLPAMGALHSQGLRGLWSMGISGDLPIVLAEAGVKAEDDRNEAYESVKKLAAFSRWCTVRGLRFDTVILTNARRSYGDRAWELLSGALDGAPNMHLLSSAALNDESLALLRAAALVCCEAGSVPYTPCVLNERDVRRDDFTPTRVPELGAETALYAANGFGGFDIINREYVIDLNSGPTPAPWCSVLANPLFGAVVTENGGGWTWFKNSRLNRLTAWEDDPISDTPHERILLCEGAQRLCLTPCGRGGKRVRHGIGYTRFECETNDIAAELTVFVHPRLALKFCRVKLRNKAFKKREMVLRYSVDWATGERPLPWAQTVRCSGGVQKVYSPFVGLDGRTAFIAGGEADAEGVHYRIALDEGASAEAVFLMGAEREESIPALAAEYTRPEAPDAALAELHSIWERRLNRLACHTGNTDIDLLVNGILLYQTYSSRLFAKTGYYQNGGAAGFRDRLQDVTALLMTDPQTARQTILESASWQFPSGDVLHWRHDDGTGVRTRITDDRLFLPYAAMEYALVTGDDSIWEESVPYLKETPIPEGKRDLYMHFEAEGGDTLFRHCLAAVNCSLRFGSHGLPLMGGGDWNDGMDEVGADGGESSFNGWLLIYVLRRFAEVCKTHGETENARRYLSVCQKLELDMERHAWSGDRYVRAFYSDGSPLGAAENECCALDAVAQCWAVFCGAGHAEQAFDTLLAGLVDGENGVIKLLAPPFKGSGKRRAGYIENYIEGVRENGAQYTHAAAWTLIAACMLGRGRDAERLFAIIDPIAHGGALNIQRYKAEPYVLAGDVYSGDEKAGRGGWTWYTGSAAWLYRGLTEYVLGLKKQGERLYIRPVNTLPGFTVEYRYGEALYRITAERTGQRSLMREGKSAAYVLLCDDGAEHEIKVTY